MPSPETSIALYRAACAWNLFWGLPLLLAPGLALANLGLPQPVTGIDELHARGAGLAVVLFGWIYLTIGTNLTAFRQFLCIAIIAKLTFFLLVAFVFLRHRELSAMLLVAVGDLAFGGLFYRDWRKPR